MHKSNTDYKDWWIQKDLLLLGRRAPLNMTREQFMSRCATLRNKLFENIQETALRKLLEYMGLITDRQIEDYRSIKLLSVITKLCEISHITGLDILNQKDEIVSRWNDEGRLLSTVCAPLRWLNDLRIYYDHSVNEEKEQNAKTALEYYGIDEKEMLNGWGLAIDKVYDLLIENMNQISQIVHNALNMIHS